MLNSQTSQDPRADLDRATEPVLKLDAADQISLFVAVLALYLRKLHLLASMTI
jgi:hypothetical protein